MRNIATGRLALLLVAFSVSLVAGYFIGNPLMCSEVASGYIATIFSILAASLFAVVSIVGDPSMLLPGSWRQGWESAKGIQGRLQRLNLLFMWYLLTLGLIVIAEVIKVDGITQWYFIYNILGFAATFGFITSFALPGVLQSIQRERLDQEIKARRR